MKKLFCSVLVFGAVAFSIFGQTSYAAFDESKIKSTSAVLMEAKSGHIFFDKQGSKRIAPASTTKILAAIIALEAGGLDKQVTVGNEINKFSSASSLMGLKTGEVVTIKDLLYGMMLASGNDAAATVGVSLGGSIDGFAQIMNAKAAELNMNNSHFTTPYGTQEDEHYSTAKDMATLAVYAMQNSAFMKIVATKEYTVKATNKHKVPLQLKSTNKLIYFDTEKDDKDYRYKYATGMKTGLTPEAKGCLVATASKNGIDLIVVIMGDNSKKYVGRWEEARALFEYGFDNFASVPLSQLPVDKTLNAPVTNVAGAESGEATVAISVVFGDQAVTGLRDQINALKTDSSAIKAELHLDKDLVAPLEKGQVVGTVAYRLDDEIIALLEARVDADVAAAEDIAPISSAALISNLAVRTNAPVNPILYWILGALVILLAYMVLRIIRLRNLRKRARAKRAVMRKQSAGRRYFMYSDSKR